MRKILTEGNEDNEGHKAETWKTFNRRQQRKRRTASYPRMEPD